MEEHNIQNKVCKYPVLSECFPNFNENEIEALYVAALRHIPPNGKPENIEVSIIEYIKQKETYIKTKKNTKNHFSRLYSYVLNNY